MKVGALSSSTVYGDSSGSTLGGADSISANGVASGSYIYGNVGNDRVSLAAGLVAGSVYGGSGADSLWVAAGASTSALIDGGVGNDFLSVAGLSGTSSLLGAVGDDTLMVGAPQHSGTPMLVRVPTACRSLVRFNAQQLLLVQVMTRCKLAACR